VNPRPEDPVLINARREAWIIAGAWLAATLYCCTYYYLFGLIRADRPLGREDVRPVLGMPSWFFWGVMLPWGVCGIFTFVFAGFFMVEDDLGKDHAADLETRIHEWGRDA
jgi:hypothetical protein